MDEYRDSEPLTDDALERAIEAALRVDHSAGFVARVRMRIAREPVREPWRPSWLLAAVGGAVIALFFAIGWRMQLDGGPAAMPTLPARPAAFAIETMAAPVRSAEPSLTTRRQSTDPRSEPSTPLATHTHSAEGPRTFKVLVSVAEAAALQQFLASAADGRLSLPPSPSPSDLLPDEIPLEPLDAVGIDPIEIEPLSPVTVREGGGL